MLLIDATKRIYASKYCELLLELLRSLLKIKSVESNYSEERFDPLNYYLESPERRRGNILTN